MSAVEETTCARYLGGEWVAETKFVPLEIPLTIYVNKQELVTMLCSPLRLNYLVMGYLYSEGIIDNRKDVASMRVCDDELEVDVILVRNDFKMSSSRTLTSGCGGGTTMATKELVEKCKVKSNVNVSPAQLTGLTKKLVEAGKTYHEYGGVHTAALADRDELLVVAEDIGRHNTLDKLAGECLLKGIVMSGRILLSTGRISSEMLLKAGRMDVPIVVSRNSITGRAISLAGELGITAVGHARGDRFTVYTRPERVGYV
ncbi:MAG TPA: formate dehydrogenase accessory sulfurtransferase FdhD [Dehalococcoidia bacterium]|nr:formate dehydrogenase accessory sulfurtransferase FdhD [Dehalococcoidia bacterium]